MEQNNPFKKIEPTEEEPRSELKKVVMKRISFTEVLGDLLGLFTVNLGRSVKDLLEQSDSELDDSTPAADKS